MNATPAPRREATPPAADTRRQLRLRNFIEVQRLSPAEQTELADDFDPGPVYDAAPGREGTPR